MWRLKTPTNARQLAASCKSAVQDSPVQRGTVWPSEAHWWWGRRRDQRSGARLHHETATLTLQLAPIVKEPMANSLPARACEAAVMENGTAMGRPSFHSRHSPTPCVRWAHSVLHGSCSRSGKALVVNNRANLQLSCRRPRCLYTRVCCTVGSAERRVGAIPGVGLESKLLGRKGVNTEGRLSSRQVGKGEQSTTARVSNIASPQARTTASYKPRSEPAMGRRHANTGPARDTQGRGRAASPLFPLHSHSSGRVGIQKAEPPHQQPHPLRAPTMSAGTDALDWPWLSWLNVSHMYLVVVLGLSQSCSRWHNGGDRSSLGLPGEKHVGVRFWFRNLFRALATPAEYSKDRPAAIQFCLRR